MKPERTSFLPRIPEDAGLIFCHDQILNNEILGSIEAAFAKKEPVKMLIYGDWGVGKTHLLYHIQYWLKQNEADYPVTPLIIEIGDLTKVSRFDEVVRPFMDRLGLEGLIKLVHDYRGIKPNVTQALRDANVSAQVAEAFSKLLMASPGSAPPQAVVMAFDYLKGRNIGKAAAAHGLSEPLSQSQDLFDVLRALGEMHLAAHQRRLLFVADEASKLEDVSQDIATEQHWLNVNKLIFADENRSFGFIYTISARRTGDLPRVLFEVQIRNRLGDNIFELKNLATNDVQTFLKKLIENFVDKSAVEALVAANTIPSARYDWNAYPFTVSAKAEFVDYFNRTQEASKPRDISKKLDAVAFVAGKQGKRLIDEDCLRAKKM
jgi:KAP-like P-loop domain-containing protein